MLTRIVPSALATCIALLLGSPAIVAQEQPIHSNPLAVGVQSPSAASLGHAAQAEVETETGALQISIPLYEVATRDGLSVPIVLEYSSNGIKTDEMPGWLGMGWRLRAGGAITRTVRGLPDEAPGEVGYPYNVAYIDANLDDGVPTQALIDEMHDGQIDTQPDLFFFSTPGASGRFIWTGTNPNVFTPLTYVPVVIEGHPATYTWNMTDNAGTFYTFGLIDGPESDNAVELTNAGTLGSGDVLTSWFLTRMEGASGIDDVRFEYDRYTTYVQHGLYKEIFNLHGEQTQVCESDEGPEAGYPVATIQEPVLNRIETEDIEVVFFSSVWATEDKPAPVDVGHGQGGSPRSYGQVRLDSMHVVNRSSDMLIKGYIFKYDYETSAWVSSGGQLGSTRRLYLEEVTEFGHDHTPLPSYVFSYDNPGAVPTRLHYGQDHWGYPNGASNVSIVPTPHNAVNRDASAVPVTAGVLTDIVYPTGGRDEFTWGANDQGIAGNPPSNAPTGGVRIERIESFADQTADVPDIVTRYSYGQDGISSGVTRMPIYAVEVSDAFGCAGWVYKASSQATLIPGSGTRYTNVAVISGVEGMPAGKTVFEYFVMGDDPGEGAWIPGAATNFDWQSSRIRERVYATDGSPISEVVYHSEYSDLYDPPPGPEMLTFPAIAARTYEVCVSSWGGMACAVFVLYQSVYNIQSAWRRIGSTSEYRY